MVDTDGKVRFKISSGIDLHFDEVIYSLTNNSRGFDITLSIAAGASDTNIEIPNVGFNGVLVFWDPNNTSKISIKLGATGNVSRRVHPAHVISGADVNGLIDIYVTNSDATNVNELRIVGILDKST